MPLTLNELVAAGLIKGTGGGVGGLLYLQPRGGLGRTYPEAIARGVARQQFGGMGGLLYLQPRGGLGYMSQSGQYGSAELDAKKAEFSGVLDNLDSALNPIASSLANVRAQLSTTSGASQAQADYQSAASALQQLQQQSAAWRSKLQSTVTPPATPSSYPISDAAWRGLDSAGKQANGALAAAQALATSVQALPQEVAAAQQAALAQASAAAQVAASNAAAQTQYQQAQLEAQQQTAALNAQQQTAQANIAAQAAAAQAQAQAQAAALQASIAERSQEFQATQSGNQAAIQAQSDQAALQAQNQAAQDQATMQLELARLQMEDASQQRKDELTANRDQQQLMLALISKMPQLAPQVLPALLGPALGPYGGGAPGYAQAPSGPDMSYGQGCDPSVDPACGAGSPMFSPMTQGPVAMAPPPVMAAQGGSGFDTSPLNPGAEMFGMGGLGHYVRRQGPWRGGVRGLGVLGPGPSPLPAGSQLETGWGARDTGSDYLLVNPDGIHGVHMSYRQAGQPNTQVTDPSTGAVIYTSPSSGDVASSIASILGAALPIAQSVEQTYNQQQAIAAATKLGKVYQPTAAVPQQASDTGTILGTIGVLGAVGLGLWYLNKRMSKRPAVLTNPGRRRRRARRRAAR